MQEKWNHIEYLEIKRFFKPIHLDVGIVMPDSEFVIDLLHRFDDGEIK